MENLTMLSCVSDCYRHSQSESAGSDQKKKSGPLLGVSRLFVGFANKGLSEYDSANSPTSPLDMKMISSPRSCCKSPVDQIKVGLSIVDSLEEDPKPAGKVLRSLDSKRVLLFTSPNSLQSETAKSLPRDFAMKTRPLLVDTLRSNSFDSSRVYTKPAISDIISSLSATDIELSEDYTCVISHGPNPKTTHIYGDCVLANFGNNNTGEEDKKRSSCCSCNKKLDQGDAALIYRSEKVFCSLLCSQEMTSGEEHSKLMENCDSIFEIGIFEA